MSDEPLGPCTQAEIDAWVQTIDSKNARLVVMWMERAKKAEAALAAQQDVIEVVELQPDVDAPGLWIGFKNAEDRRKALKHFRAVEQGAT